MRGGTGGIGPSEGPGNRGGNGPIIREFILKSLPVSCCDVRGFGGVGGAVDLNPELGNPVRGGADATPEDRWMGMALSSGERRYPNLSISAGLE